MSEHVDEEPGIEAYLNGYDNVVRRGRCMDRESLVRRIREAYDLCEPDARGHIIESDSSTGYRLGKVTTVLHRLLTDLRDSLDEPNEVEMRLGSGTPPCKIVVVKMYRERVSCSLKTAHRKITDAVR